ncbi:MAG TPA: LacI family transcriptional regulator [Clostridiales bacterium]|nr:LacI family transcriptional regulator [Clostridiales bacterium]
MKPRLSDIARIAGVSKATASRALANSPLVKEETKRRVLEVAKQYNYQPNALAQAVATKRSGILGFCMHKSQHPYFGHSFFGPMLDGAIEEARRHNYHILVAPADPANTTFDEHFIQDSIDGVILATFTPMEPIQEFRRRNIPLVLVNDAVPTPNNAFIVQDEYGGAKAVMRHLIKERGHRKIAFISDRLSHLSYYLRYLAYLDAHREYGLELYNNPKIKLGNVWGKFPRPDRQKLEMLGQKVREIEGTPIIIEGIDSSQARDAVYPILMATDDKDLPTAIFAATDSLALGTIEAIWEAGLEVPRDIAVAGFDDLPMSAAFTPPLTTVHSNPFEMGQAAVQELLKLIADPQRDSTIRWVDTHLVVRKST